MWPYDLKLILESETSETLFFDFIAITSVMIITYNGLRLREGGDFEALHCQTSKNFDRSTKLDLTTEPPLLGRCCYA